MKRRDKPTLVGVRAKADRAETHFRELSARIDPIEEPGACTFVGSRHRENRDHVYRPIDPPGVESEWSLALGDCIHNYRSALDHLAYQLVLAHNLTPTETTQFPIRSSELWRNPNTGTIEPRAINISPGIDPDALDLIKHVQPYNGTNDGRKLRLIHDLDVIDKHRRMLLTVHAINRWLPWSTAWSEGNEPPTVIDKWYAESLIHNEPAVRLTYERPYHQLDPHLQFRTSVAFRDGPFVGRPVQMVLGTLRHWLLDEFVPRFLQFFPSGTTWPT